MKLLIIERPALSARRSGQDVRAVGGDLSLVELEAVARLTHGGYHVVLASHQPNVARGLIEMSAVNAEHRRLIRQIEEVGGRIDAVAVCPHAPDAGCSCRMPQPGMVLDLIKRFDSVATQTVMVAATGAAVTAGLAAGCSTLRLGVDDDDDGTAPVPMVADLTEVAARLLPRGGADGAVVGG